MYKRDEVDRSREGIGEGMDMDCVIKDTHAYDFPI